MRLRQVEALFGKKVPELGGDAVNALRKEYNKSIKKVEQIAKLKSELKLSEEAWEDALSMWDHNLTITADEFLSKLPDYAPGIPTQAMGPVHNTGKSKAVSSPKSVLDDESRQCCGDTALPA